MKSLGLLLLVLGIFLLFSQRVPEMTLMRSLAGMASASGGIFLLLLGAERSRGRY